MTFSNYLAILIILLAVALLFMFISKNGLIKDDSNCVGTKPFSLAKTQFAFWTLIVFSSFVFLISENTFIIESVQTNKQDQPKDEPAKNAKKDIILLSGTAMLLLGISGGTAVLGKTIDTSDQQRINTVVRAGSPATPRHQDECSQGFLLDLLSDENGVSIHRFQNVIFTVVLMISFVVFVCTKGSMPEWDATLLTLSGISSAGYLGVKTNENN